MSDSSVGNNEKQEDEREAALSTSAKNVRPFFSRSLTIEELASIEESAAGKVVVSSKVLEDVCHQAEAFSSFANISALIFGFALPLIWNESDSAKTAKTSPLYCAKIILLSVAVCLAGFALVVHAIQYYVLMELVSKKAGTAITTWAAATEKIRGYARHAMWYSLGSFMISTACHLFDAIDQTLAAIAGGILIAGTFIMGGTVVYMRPSKILKEYYLSADYLNYQKKSA
jgi:hypothetical protein